MVSAPFGRKRRESGLCKMLDRPPQHGKGTSGSTVGRHSDHIKDSLDVCQISTYKDYLALPQNSIQGEQKWLQNQSCIFRAKIGQKRSKRINLISSYFLHAIEKHV